MATFNPRYVNLDNYEAAQLNRTAKAVSPLDSALQGFQQGIQLQQLPQQLQDQALARQLQNALVQQKLQDLQNPEAALARELQKIVIKEAVTNPNSGIIQSPIPGATIATPNAVDQTAESLNAALALNPNTPIPSAAPGLPITPIGTGAVQTGLSVDPNIPQKAELDKLNRQIQLLNARPINQTITKEGYAFNPRTGQLEQMVLPTNPDVGLEEQRRLQVIADAQAKAQEANAALDKKQSFTSEQNDKKIASQERIADKNIEARQTLADKRSKLAPAEAAPYQVERQQRVLDSVTDLEKDVGYDTVGFADWFKAIPTTPAKSFASRLKTLKAAIAFGELAAMREASKTGGALGAVSNTEIGLLESSLGALDQAQSPSEFKEELGKIRDSIQRWQSATGRATPPLSNAAPTPSSPHPSPIKIKSIKLVK